MPLLANDLPLLRACSFSRPAGCRDNRQISAAPVNPCTLLSRVQLISVTSWKAQPND